MNHVVRTFFTVLMLIFCIFTLCFQAVTFAAIGEIKVTPPDNSQYQAFGRSVSIYDNWAVIGACRDNTADKNAGAAYIYKNESETWIQYGKLVPDDLRPHDYFGYSVSISEEYVAVSAINDNFNSGSVYIFKKDNENWIMDARLRPDNLKRNSNFGYSVAISGNCVIIGAYRDDGKTVESGAAYIFEKTGNEWVEKGKLVAGDGQKGDHFGRSVAIYGDYALIGAIHVKDNGVDSGAVYIFRKIDGKWIQKQKLVPQDSSLDDYFGFSIGIYDDHIIVGSSSKTENGITSGAAYIFQKNGDNWIQKEKLMPADGHDNDFFGCSVAISDGYAIVGADGDDDTENNSGAAYIYKKDSETWIIEKKLNPADKKEDDRFAWSVSIFSSTNENYSALAGAFGDDTAGDGAGAAYFYVEADSPRIESAPDSLNVYQSLSVTQAYDSTNQLTAGYKEPGADPCSMGLVIPDSVREYWLARKSPPKRPGYGTLPSSIDWSIYDSPVKSQGVCGACSVFSAVALLENLARRTGLSTNPDYSEQVILSCTPEIGCQGGWYWDALKYIEENGVPPEACYPYISGPKNCQNRCEYPEYIAKISWFTKSPGLWGEDHTADDIKLALQDGPLAAAMRVPNDGTFVGEGYKGGVYNYNGGFIPWNTNGHAILIVGYDDELECFKAKNSWGPYWGENGYFRISYDDVEDDVKFGSYACKASGAFLEGYTSTFNITNKGSATLIITSMTADKPWIKFTPGPVINILPNRSQIINVSVDWSLVTSPIETGRIAITSNDPDTPIAYVSITATRSPGLSDIAVDLDGDGKTDLKDTLMALKILSGINPDGIRHDILKADINKDGQIGLAEAIYALESAANLRN